MTAKLHALPGAEPNGAVIRLLEAMLERARSGELRGAVVCFQTHDNIGHGFAWDRTVSPMSLVGEMNLASFAIHIETGRIKPPG